MLEQEAVVSRLSEVKIDEHPISGTKYKVGILDSQGRKLKIAVGRSNQTNVNAGIETERMIQLFNPSHIFFVGIAGGLKDVSIGDIVIGSEVVGYERGKVEIEFLPRIKFSSSSYDLEMRAVDFSSSPEWEKRSKQIVNTMFKNKISVFSGTIVSGEKVLASTKSDLYNFIKVNFSHALAIEMEGLGFLEACRHYSLIKSLIIRGISDLLDGKGKSDNEGSQYYAANNAAEFFVSFIDNLELESNFDQKNLRQNIFEIVTKLYPEGIKDKGIWSRSGGDLSLIPLNVTGKAQWIEALKLIENGGGGNELDFVSLLRTMKEDYPKHDLWKLI
ncbi:phosphorylase family protein [Leptospira interrogans str. FPW2026]|nr:phosphorylase family protein [Leptospira interrogans str. FPW2026]EMN65276.1 phosphorylase family protein [Leptospira interrogans serovar Grippotyphosa str. UI 08434]